MWHASTSSLTDGADVLETWARSLLYRVGDRTAGEWIDRRRADDGRTTVHIRRRLTKTEAGLAPAVRDLRGTREHKRRAQAISDITGIPAAALLQMG